MWIVPFHYCPSENRKTLSKTSRVLCGTLVLMCVVSILRYSLTWVLSTERLVIFWALHDWFLISSYTMHLIFWGQLYEQSAELVLLSQSNITPKLRRFSYLYIGLIGTDTVGMVSIYELIPSTQKWILFTWVGNYFSLALITLLFLIYLYKNSKMSKEYPHNKKARTTVGLLALVSLFYLYFGGYWI